MRKLLPFFLIAGSFQVFAQPGTDILLFDLDARNSQIVLSRGINITNRKGYDNQPFFHPSQPVIYYSSSNDSGRTDIKYYNFESKENNNLTLTREREYSPTVTPNGEFISCILQRDNGAQDLCQYPIMGGKPQILINHLKIGYHAWAGPNKLLLYVLDDSTHNSLHYYYLDKNADTVIAENIGRSLHKIPGQNAMSFVQKISEQLSIIKRFDMNTGVISTIIPTLSGQDQFTWLQNNVILMSDGSRIFSFHLGKDQNWEPVKILGHNPELKGITRLATDLSNSKLAVVVNE